MVRIVTWWLIVGALVLIAVLEGDSGLPDAEIESAPAEGTEDKFRITSVRPAEVYAGSAVLVDYTGRILVPEATKVEIAKQPAEIVHAGPDQLVVRVSPDLPPGSAKLRIIDGERRSKPRTLRIKPLRLRRILRDLVGGLALFVFGLRTLAKGMRGYAGRPLRVALGRWTQGTVRGLGFGVLAGTAGQSVTSAAAFVVGLLRSRLVNHHAALVVLIGAHLGAGTAIFVLPLGFSGGALWIVALGVAVVTMAKHRRAESAGQLLLGMGLLFYGLSVLRSGFEPLIGDPDVLPYLESMRVDGPLGTLSRLGGGAVLGGLLQGPGAAFGLVLGIGETTGLLSLRQGLEIMAGTNVGASVGVVLVALPFGRYARRLAVAHVVACVAITLVFVAAIGPSMALGDGIVGADPTLPEYGKKVLLPNFAEHLALAFACAQLTGVAVAAALAGKISSAVFGALTTSVVARPADDASDMVYATLARGLGADRSSMEASLALLTTGERQQATTGEAQIASVRAEVKGLVQTLARSGTVAAKAALPACVAVLQLQQSLEQLQSLAERGIEKDYQLDAVSTRAFTDLHGLACDGVDRVLRHLSHEEPLDIEHARGQEIATNAREHESRQQLLSQLPDRPRDEPTLLWSVEVISTYETVGNQLYRLATALVAPEDDF